MIRTAGSARSSLLPNTDGWDIVPVSARRGPAWELMPPGMFVFGIPNGQRSDMTGSLPRRRRRKLSRNPGTETDKKLFPKSRPPAVPPRSAPTTKKSPPDLNDSAGFSVVPRSEGPARSFPRHEENLASTAATCAREAWLPGDRFPSPVPRISPSPTAQPMASRAQGEI